MADGFSGMTRRRSSEDDAPVQEKKRPYPDHYYNDEGKLTGYGRLQIIQAEKRAKEEAQKKAEADALQKIKDDQAAEVARMNAEIERQRQEYAKAEAERRKLYEQEVAKMAAEKAAFEKKVADEAAARQKAKVDDETARTKGSDLSARTALEDMQRKTGQKAELLVAEEDKNAEQMAAAVEQQDLKKKQTFLEKLLGQSK